MKPYRELVGAISYIAQVTRPDCQWASTQLASVQNNPGQAHWRLAKRVLKYLARGPEYGPTYVIENDGDDHQFDDGVSTASHGLTYFVDASFADIKTHDFGINDDGRRSTYGYVAMMAGGPVNWKSRMLPGKRCLSSTESELKAATLCACDLLDKKWLALELGCTIDKPIKVYEDNQSCIHILLNDGLGTGEKLKHLEYHWFFARDCVNAKDMEVLKIHTSVQPGDVVTKSLGGEAHNRHSQKLVGQAYSVDVGKAYYTRKGSLVAPPHEYGEGGAPLVRKPAFAVHMARLLPDVPQKHYAKAQAHYCACLRLTC